MAVIAARASVGTTATLLSTGKETDTNHLGRSVAVYNPGPTDVYLGGQGVTSAAGYLLSEGATLSADLEPRELLYAIAASGTQTIHVLQTGV